MSTVEWMVADGLGDKLLFSHDIGLKARLSSFGGPGWDHIMNVILPVAQGPGHTDRGHQQHRHRQIPARVLGLAYKAT